MTDPRYDADQVRDALRAAAVLDHYGWNVRGRGRNVQSSRCPNAEHDNPRALVMNVEDGTWQCWPCRGAGRDPHGGNLIGFIAAVEQLATNGADFGKVLAIAADIAGVLPTTGGVYVDPGLRREAQRRRLEEHRARLAEQKREKRERSIPIATAYWEQLARRHPAGEAYLAERGVLEVLERGLVRFDGELGGAPALAIHASDRRIVNVARRQLPARCPSKDKRFLTLGGCVGLGTYIGALADVRAGVDVVVTEGFFDALVAACAFPLCAIVGARDAAGMDEITPHIARRAHQVGARMFLVPHRDKAGLGALRKACSHARAAGLRLSGEAPTLHVFFPQGAGDLADAWAAGWRPEPEQTA
jgi:hypothetical protein